MSRLGWMGPSGRARERPSAGGALWWRVATRGRPVMPKPDQRGRRTPVAGGKPWRRTARRPVNDLLPAAGHLGLAVRSSGPAGSPYRALRGEAVGVGAVGGRRESVRRVIGGAFLAQSRPPGENPIPRIWTVRYTCQASGFFYSSQKSNIPHIRVGDTGAVN